MSEVLEGRLADLRGGIGVYYNALAEEPYRLHFFVVELIGEEPATGGYRPVTQFGGMSVVLETADGEYETAPPDVLHDLQPAEDGISVPPADPEVRQRLERLVRGKRQRELLDEQRQQREREIGIREDYMKRTFDALVRATERKYLDLADKVASGDVSYRIARDEAARRVEELETRQRQKLDDLKHMRVLRPGPIRYLGSAEVRPAVLPALNTANQAAMRSDPEVERRAMEHVIQYERERGWQPTDISQLHDGSGFDIRSVGPADQYGRRPVCRIEVKGRSGYNVPVALTPNEWLQAGRHGETYW